MKIQIKNNDIINDGVLIGILDGRNVILDVKVGPRVKSEIKKAAGDDGLKFIDRPPPDVMPEFAAQPIHQKVPFPVPAVDKVVEAMVPLVNPPTPEPPRARTLEEAVKIAAIKTKDAAYQSLIVAVERGEIPPPPAQLAALGDKTPAFVDWVRKHATPEEFETIYGRRKLPTLQDYQNGERKRRRIAGEKID